MGTGIGSPVSMQYVLHLLLDDGLDMQHFRMELARLQAEAMKHRTTSMYKTKKGEVIYCTWTEDTRQFVWTAFRPQWVKEPEGEFNNPEYIQPLEDEFIVRRGGSVYLLEPHYGQLREIKYGILAHRDFFMDEHRIYKEVVYDHPAEEGEQTKVLKLFLTGISLSPGLVGKVFSVPLHKRIWSPPKWDVVNGDHPLVYKNEDAAEYALSCIKAWDTATRTSRK